MFCPQCGGEYDDSFAFCSHCGAKNPHDEQSQAQATPTPQAPAPQPTAQSPVVVEKKSSSGCLIALAIVAVIGLVFVAIILAIAIPVYNSARKNAQRRTCQSNLRTVDSAVEAYEADTEQLPTSLEDMVQAGSQVLKSIPTCPAGDDSYIWVEGTPPSISCPNDASHTI